MSLLSLSAFGSKLSKPSPPVNGSPDDRVIRAGPLLLQQGSGQSSSRRHTSRRKSSTSRNSSPTPDARRSSSRTHSKPREHRSRGRSSVGPESRAARPRLKAIEETPKAAHQVESRRRRHRRTSAETSASRRSDLQSAEAVDDALQERVRSLVSPSLSSLLTTSTHASSSSGSTSTVTQTSYAYSLSTNDSMPSKLQRLRKARAKERQISSPGPKEASLSDKVDVFQFMEPVPEVVKEEKEESDSSSSEEEEEEEEEEKKNEVVAAERQKVNPQPAPNVTQAAQPSAPPPTRRPLASSNPVYRKHRDSLHSDSGISVRDSSPDSVGRSSKVYRCPTVEAISDREEEESSSSDDDDGEDEEEEHHPKSDSSPEPLSSPELQMRRKSASSIDPRQAPHPMHPPAYPPQYPYTPRTPHSNKLVPYVPPQAFAAGPLPPPAPSPPHWSSYHTRPRRSSESGYDLLASQLCSAQEHSDGPQLTPLYRKFEYPQHRILLYLQDEISELEEHLRHLDECIADSAHPSASGALAPESRRADSRWGMGLEHQRTDLLGRLYVKLNQYHQAITQFNSMAKSNDAAGAADVASYKAWLREKTPIVDSEVRFLDHETDLIRLDRTRQPERGDDPACSHHHYHEPRDEKSAALASLNTRQALIVSPAVFILVFLAISSVRHWFARLVVLAIIGAATGTGLHYSTLGKRYFASPEELVACIALYTGVFACISMAMA